MINIVLSSGDYEYDIRSLVKAFYPDEDIELSIGDKAKITENDSKIYIIVVFSAKVIFIDYYYNGINKHHEATVDFSNDIDTAEIKPRYKNIVKKAIYKLFSEITNKELPWGTLTGIRPTKIAMDKLENGYSEDETKAFFYDNYLCSERKTELAVEIAKKELEIIRDFDYRNGYSLYIGIPFCPTTCLYCSFTSYSAEKYADLIEPYLDALFMEIDCASKLIKNKKLNTVYIGGGTPTTLNEEQLVRLIDKIKQCFDFRDVCEFTVEAGRPDSITMKKLVVLKQNGVTRISINPQTMNQSTLDIIGRKHTVEQIKDAIKIARTVGHNNINMDIILGLPGEKIDDIMYTLEEIDKLNPDSITVHTLAVKRAAYLNIYKERYKDMLPEHVEDMVDFARSYAYSKDYMPYYLYRQKNMTDNLENIGYAKKGKEGIYNILIMEEKQTILALGAGAVCKFVDYSDNRISNIDRVDNVKSIKDYIERIGDMIKKKEKYIRDKGADSDEIF